MGSSAPMRLAAPILISLALVVPAMAGAGILQAPTPGVPVLAATGDESELLTKVPIARTPGARDRVAMRLAPDRFEPIATGDRLRVSGEVQMSTTCVDPGSRCIGTNYETNPTLDARIVLSPSPKADSGFFPLSPSRTVLCKQQRPNRNHHCTLTIPNTETVISDLSALPCPADGCYVELIVGAHNPKAKRGNVVVLGGDQPDGSVAQDKGRLNLVQAHAGIPDPTVTSSTDLVTTELPLTIADAEKKRVVYSVPVQAPQKGEVLAFDTRFTTGIGSLHYNTFISSRVITAKGPTDTKSRGYAKRAIPLKGQATESNGFNCTLGPSGFTNACTTVKAGAVRFERDVIDHHTDQPATIYLNVLAGAKPLLAEKVDESDRVALGSLPGGLTVARYSPGSGGVTAP
jgi:hypothetical protein